MRKIKKPWYTEPLPIATERIAKSVRDFLIALKRNREVLLSLSFVKNRAVGTKLASKYLWLFTAHDERELNGVRLMRFDYRFKLCEQWVSPACDENQKTELRPLCAAESTTLVLSFSQLKEVGALDLLGCLVRIGCNELCQLIDFHLAFKHISRGAFWVSQS